MPAVSVKGKMIEEQEEKVEVVKPTKQLLAPRFKRLITPHWHLSTDEECEVDKMIEAMVFFLTGAHESADTANVKCNPKAPGLCGLTLLT